MRELLGKFIFVVLLFTFVADVVNIQRVVYTELTEELVDLDESFDDFDDEYKLFKSGDFFASFKLKSSEFGFHNKRQFNQILAFYYARPVIEPLSPPPESNV